MDEVKQWKFEVPSGTLTLKLSSYATAGKPADTVLLVDLARVSESPMASRDLVAPLAEVFKEMPSLGYNPSRLVMISTAIGETEYKDGINRAVQKSGVWKACIGMKYCHSALPIANKCLESMAAYSDLDGVLGAVGLRRVQATADDMACGKDADGNALKIVCNGVIHLTTISLPH